MRDYLKEHGADNAAPVGKHQTTLSNARTNVDDETDVPSFSAMSRISGGQYDSRTFFNNLRWFVKETDQDGEAKSEEQIARGEGFMRQITTDFITSIVGKTPAEWPEDLLMPESGDTLDEVAKCFRTWEKYVNDEYIQVTIKDQKNSDFQNFSYAQAREETDFSGKL
jgi:hypothetical protein